jgi:Uncharacterised nucleotidyltransferase
MTTSVHARAVRTLYLEHLAAQTVAAFTERGIAVILMKGASFAQLFYPDGGRSYGDVDLLVPRTQFAAAQALLEAYGFTAGPLFPLSHAVTLERRNPRGLVEAIDLHWTLPCLLEAPDRLWSQLSQRTRSIEVGGGRVNALDEIGCALQVALHAAHHCDGGPDPEGVSSRTAMDLDRAVAILDADIWQQASELARALDIESGFACGLRQTPRGAALAASLALPSEAPPLWAFPCGAPARGVRVINRILSPGSARDRCAPAFRALLPPASTCRAQAGTRLGRRNGAVARFEWWWGLARNLVPAVRGSRPRNR